MYSITFNRSEGIIMKKLYIPILIFLITLGCDVKLDVNLSDNSYISYRDIPTRYGPILRFAIVLPECLNEDQSYPVLLALPPGEQSRNNVEFGLENYWIKASIMRNWIVVSPIASDGAYFYGEGAVYIPDLFDWIEEEFNVEGGKFHVAGPSAGGMSAFRVAVDNPSRCHSMTAMPGYPLADAFAKLDTLRDVSIAMFVGAYDEPFRVEMDSTAAQLDVLGIPYTYRVLPSDSHTISSLSSEAWLNLLDGFRPEN